LKGKLFDMSHTYNMDAGDKFSKFFEPFSVYDIDRSYYEFMNELGKLYPVEPGTHIIEQHIISSHSMTRKKKVHRVTRDEISYTETEPRGTHRFVDESTAVLIHRIVDDAKRRLKENGIPASDGTGIVEFHRYVDFMGESFGKHTDDYAFGDPVNTVIYYLSNTVKGGDLCIHEGVDSYIDDETGLGEYEDNTNETTKYSPEYKQKFAEMAEEFKKGTYGEIKFPLDYAMGLDPEVIMSYRDTIYGSKGCLIDDDEDPLIISPNSESPTDMRVVIMDGRISHEETRIRSRGIREFIVVHLRCKQATRAPLCYTSDY
jgi:hypothetical protein